MYFLATRTRSSACHRVDLRRVILEVGLGQILCVDARDSGGNSIHRREAARERLNERLLSHRQFVVREGYLALDALEVRHESDQRAVALRAYDAAASAEGARPATEGEGRIHAIAIALHFPDVMIQARLKHAAKQVVHHLDRVVVGRAARGPGLTKANTDCAALGLSIR